MVTSAPFPDIAGEPNVGEPESSGSSIRRSAGGKPEDAAGVQRLSRLKRLVHEHHALVWRTLRRLGVLEKDVEDATQRVFIVVGTKIGEIGEAQERSFVFGVAMRIASEERRSHRRHPEDLVAEHHEQADPGSGPEAGMRRGELLELLATILKRLPAEQQSVFMLHEFEEMSLSEIAAMLEIPPGTAASRLRRARRAFGQLVSEYREAYELEAT